MVGSRYVGEELPIFAAARHWKAYIRTLLAQHLRGRVLEVGAGLGTTTAVLWSSGTTQWTCLEPDPSLAEQCARQLESAVGPGVIEVIRGKVADLPDHRSFDTILYIDVLEHIRRDREELALATAHLAPGGTLVVLSPAYQCLYSEFDRAIGHCRRYSKRSLAAIVPPTLRRERLLFADSLGVLLSLGNRLILRQHAPSLRQILFWDRVIVPLSRIVDSLLGHSFGRSILGVYRGTGPVTHWDGRS